MFRSKPTCCHVHSPTLQTHHKTNATVSPCFCPERNLNLTVHGCREKNWSLLPAFAVCNSSNAISCCPCTRGHCTAAVHVHTPVESCDPTSETEAPRATLGPDERPDVLTRVLSALEVSASSRHAASGHLGHPASPEHQLHAHRVECSWQTPPRPPDNSAHSQTQRRLGGRGLPASSACSCPSSRLPR